MHQYFLKKKLYKVSKIMKEGLQPMKITLQVKWLNLKSSYIYFVVFFFPKDSNYGYTKDNCANEAKKELLAQELLGCSFQSIQTALTRCNVEDSVRFYRSFIDTNNTDIFRVNVVNISSKEGLKDRYDKTCIQDCIQDR